MVHSSAKNHWIQEAMYALQKLRVECIEEGGAAVDLDLVVNLVRVAIEADDAKTSPASELPTPTKKPAKHRGQVAPLPTTQPPATEPVPASASGDTPGNLEQSIAAAALASGRGGTESKRVGLAVIEPFVIDTRNTLGRAALGRRASAALFKVVVVVGPASLVLGGFYVVGLVVGALALLGAIPSLYSFAIFMACPMWLGQFSLLNIELLKQLLADFNCILLLLYSVAWIVSLAMSFDDERIYYVAFGSLGFFYLVFLDASPEDAIYEYAQKGALNFTLTVGHVDDGTKVIMWNSVYDGEGGPMPPDGSIAEGSDCDNFLALN